MWSSGMSPWQGFLMTACLHAPPMGSLELVEPRPTRHPLLTQTSSLWFYAKDGFRDLLPKNVPQSSHMN